MISTNSVRNLVMHLLNKSNFGYITPDEYNSFSNLAQLDVFEDLFYQYTNWLNKENKRMTNSEYANIPKNIQEQIDAFSTYTNETNFTYNTLTNYWGYSGNDLYRAENLSLVNSQGRKTDVELVSKSKLNRMVNLGETSPSFTYPAYERVSDLFRIYPILTTGYSAELFFLRKPKEPKWTFTNVLGNPIYNASASDFQNFELHPSNFVPLVMKILGYAGLNLREEQVQQASNSEEVKKIQTQS
jgi:hypothetical protein